MSDESIIKYALEHDLDEILTGDIPSPTKRRASSLGLDLKRLEYKGQNTPNHPQVILIVKAADLIENLWFIREHGVGRHANEECVLLKGIVDEFIGDLDPSLRLPVNDVRHEVEKGGFFRYE